MSVSAERTNQRRMVLLILLVLFFTLPTPHGVTRAQEGAAGTVPVSPPPDQGDPALTEQTATLRVQTLMVTASVTVVDSDGRPIYDLDQNDFVVLDNGVPQELQRFEVEARPPAVVVLVETNRRIEPLIDPVRSLGPNISHLMAGPQGKVAVVTYDEQVRILQDFTNDSDKVNATLSKIVARGSGARLNDGLLRAIAMLERQPKDQRRIIMVFSDCRDQGSETSKAEVVRRATTAEVVIYGLGFSSTQALLMKQPEVAPPGPLDANVTRPLPSGMPTTPTNADRMYSTPIPVVPIVTATGRTVWSVVASNLLEYYAGYTGGVFHSHWSTKTLEDQVGQLATQINSQYELAYVPTTLNEMGFHRLEVRVASRPKLKVRTRAGYFYAGQAPAPEN